MVFKSFAKLFAGNVAVQVTTLLFYPILGRIYSPQDFGLFGVISSLGVVLGIFANGQLHMAFPQLEENSTDGIDLLKLCVLYTLGSSIFIGTLAYLGVFESLISNDQVHWAFIPLFIFAYGLSEICKMWIYYLRKYGLGSIFVSSNRFTSNLLKMFFSKSLGLIYSEILSNFLAVVAILKVTRVNFSGARPLKPLLKRFSSYPMLYTFGSLAQSLQQELPVFMFKQIFAANVVGLYVMANRFTVQSVILVSSSLIVVLANKRDDSRKDRVKHEIYTILKYCTPLSILLFVFLKFFAEEIFLLFLGPNWSGIGEVSSYLSILVLPKMIYVPIYAEILRAGRVKLLTLLRGSQVLGAFALFYVLKNWDFISLLKAYVAFDFVTDTIIILISLFFIGKKSTERGE